MSQGLVGILRDLDGCIYIQVGRDIAPQRTLACSPREQ